MNSTLEVIKSRRSIREFKKEQIKDEELKAVVEAGLYAPNAGSDPWHFTVIQNEEVLERLNKSAKEFASTCGLPWLEDLGKDETFHSSYHAPSLILVSCNEKSIAPETDTACATENILIAAEALGLGACFGYFVTQAFLSSNGEELKEELKIPSGYKVYTSAMLGYKKDKTPHIKEVNRELITYIK